MVTPFPAPALPYGSIRAQVRDYDLILFQGRRLVSRLIELGTGSRFSHVGTAKWIGEVLLLAESTPRDGARDFFTRRAPDGVRVVSLSDRIARYPGLVYWWPLVGPRTPLQAQTWERVRRELSGIRYEHDWIEFVGASSPLIRNRTNRAGMFCSETETLRLRRLGILLDDGEPENEKTPEDLSPEADRPISWAPGWSPARLVRLLPD